MNAFYFRGLFLICALVTAGPTSAQHSTHQNHGGAHSITAGPTESGDSSFAAIAEIVHLLTQDPDTDWERVDINALRVHLVDMSQLVLGAIVETQDIPNGLRMTISRSGRAGDAATRMVPSHSSVLADETGWSSTVVSDSMSIVWSVTDPESKDVAQIRALAFFGLMATGHHHSEHHFAMAKGVFAHD